MFVFFKVFVVVGPNVWFFSVFFVFLLFHFVSRLFVFTSNYFEIVYKSETIRNRGAGLP